MAVLHWRKLPEIPPIGVSVICYFKCPDDCFVKHVPTILELRLIGKSKHMKEWTSPNDSEVVFNLDEVDSWAYIEPPPWRK